MIDIFVEGTPKAQPRPRATVRGGRAAVYNPETAKDWKKSIKDSFWKYWGTKTEAPIELTITFFLPRPKNLYRKADPDGVIIHTKKPDKDNLEKAVMDALTDAGVWKDDSQVYRSTTDKFYAAKAGPIGARIMIREAI